MDRPAKERARLDRQMERWRMQLSSRDEHFHRHPAAEVGPIERKVGKWLGRATLAEKVLEVKRKRDAQPRVCGVEVVERKERLEWARQAHGAYLWRTNHGGGEESALWPGSIQLTQAEAAFRVEKSDLTLRPVFHQKTQRVQAHVLGCFLALALWRVLEQWMASKGLGTWPRNLREEWEERRMMDVALPTILHPRKGMPLELEE